MQKDELNLLLLPFLRLLELEIRNPKTETVSYTALFLNKFEETYTEAADLYIITKFKILITDRIKLLN